MQAGNLSAFSVIPNQVQLCGTVDSAPALSHVNHGVSFYKFTLAVERLSALLSHRRNREK